MDGGRAGA